MAFRASVSPKGRYRGAAWTPLEAARGAAQLAAMGAQDWWEAGASGNLSTWERMHTEQNHAQGHGDNGPRRRRRKAPSQLELFVRALSLMLAGLFALRLLHLIMEARSVILTERANEAEFMQDCRSGRAASSRPRSCSSWWRAQSRGLRPGLSSVKIENAKKEKRQKIYMHFRKCM